MGKADKRASCNLLHKHKPKICKADANSSNFCSTVLNEHLNCSFQDDKKVLQAFVKHSINLVREENEQDFLEFEKNSK